MAQEVNLKDGASGEVAKVDVNKRVHVASLGLTQREAAAHLEESYNWNTGDISLTGSATTSGVIFLENKGDDDLVVKLQLLFFGASTSGTGEWDISTYKNIGATSTLVSGASLPDINGINYHTSGADTPTDAICYKGVEGATLVGGVKILSTLMNAGATIDSINTDLVIGKNENIAVYVTTQTSNTAMNCRAVLSGYYEHDNITIE